MTDQITRERALDLLRQAVNQEGYGPGYVYPSAKPCVHVDRDGPACLVGHALHLGGMSRLALRALDIKGIHGARLPITVEAAEVLEAARASQDARETWGQALAVAEAVAR